MAEPRSEATQKAEDYNQGPLVTTTDGKEPPPVPLTAPEERPVVRQNVVSDDQSREKRIRRARLGNMPKEPPTPMASGIQRTRSTRTTALEETAGDNATSGKTMPPTPPYTPGGLETGYTSDESTSTQDEGSREESRVNRGISPVQHEPVFRQESEEEIVGDGMIKVVEEEAIFESTKHKFRLRVQKDSVADQDQTAGPITVSILDDKIEFEGTPLKGMLQVKCLPTGRRFNAPLLFDFPVGGEETSNPIMDENGRVLYEVLMKEHEGDKWIRDPEERAAPLVIKEGDQVYIRVSVRHFSWFSLWEKMEIAPQSFKQESGSLFPWHRPQILVQNDTEGVDIHVYVAEMSQLIASLNSAKDSTGAEGVEVTGEVTGNVTDTSTIVAPAPQLRTIHPGSSNCFKIPRCEVSKLSSRPAAVCIFTQTVDDEEGTPRMWVEGLIHLRFEKLTVKLPVENGRVLGTPAASDPGGILSQIMRVVTNMENASSHPPSETSSTSHPGVWGFFRRSRAAADLGSVSPSSSEHRSG